MVNRPPGGEAAHRRGDDLTAVVSDAMKEAEVISADVTGMITGIQFQDRTRQRLEHVVDTLHVVDEGLEELKRSTEAWLPGPFDETSESVEWVAKLLDRFTLGDLRARFVTQILEGKQPTEALEKKTIDDTPSTSGTVELF